MSEMEEFDHDYWRMRDFEYAQPLYDFAFLLEIEAISNGENKPKYRTHALWKAALRVDSYGTTIDRWLDQKLDDTDLDQVPSNRIKTYLQRIRETGSIPEVSAFSENERYRRCLRLRRLRGLGPAQIAQTLDWDRPSIAWLEQAKRNCSSSEDAILSCLEGTSYGTWQKPHVLPPLLRFLRSVEENYDAPPSWELDDFADPFHPITSERHVSHNTSDFPRLRRICKKVVETQNMFAIEPGSRGFLRIEHSMGWSFRLDSGAEVERGASAQVLAAKMDPLTEKRTGGLHSDLHLHTSWSDGAASANAMAEAAAENGLTYIVITDHSRSSKVQRGLTPIEWFRQSNSLRMADTAIPVLHGIEVDILSDGRLDLPKGLLDCADFVVASVHSNWTNDRTINTRRLITAIESGCVDSIGHPTSAVTGKPGVPDYIREPADLDWEEVFSCCAKWEVAVEFNCFPSRFDLSPGLLRKAVDAGCWLSLGSDAHARAHLAHLRFGQRIADDLAGARVLNLLSLDEIRAWVRGARAKRRKTLPTESPKLQQGLLFDDERVRCVEPVEARLAPPAGIPDGSPIVGIDLTGSDKPTGVAFLQEDHVETCSLVSDDELLEFIRNKKPAIVSIDSPLGLPGGGKTVDRQAGIVRVAEHDLSSIGISAYPALIDSMKELTLRGIRLRHRIESMEPSPIVIESYPGAAQDILCLPRKQRSLDLLREGLAELGLTGPGLYSTSHDEIDAITSAVVGRFYESGKYEAMGIPSEAQLIVPTHQLLSFERPPVICLCGRSGVGKSVVARYLSVFYGFQWCRTRDVVRDLLLEDASHSPENRLFHRDISAENVTESDLQEFGGVLLHNFGQVPLRQRLCETIEHSDGPLVVDAIRHRSDISEANLNGRPVFNWFVESSNAAVQARLRARAKCNPAKRGAASPVDETTISLRSEADLILKNSGTLEELRWTVDDEFLSLVRITACVSMNDALD